MSEGGSLPPPSLLTVAISAWYDWSWGIGVEWSSSHWSLLLPNAVFPPASGTTEHWVGAEQP